MIRKTFSLISITIFLIGLSGFILARYDSHDTSCSKELSLNDLQGIIVTKNAIYIGLGYYSRIQKYDLTGSYLKCYKTNTFSKTFTFYINADEEPQVGMKNVSSQQVQDIIKYQEFDEKINEYLKNSQANQQLQNPTQYNDGDGNLYKVKGWFFKKLVKITDGKEEVIIEQTLLQNLFNGYMVPWLFGFLGIICFFFTNVGIIIQNAAGPQKFSLGKTFIDIFK